MQEEAKLQAWTVDQIAKSIFFHQKLHEWRLIEVFEVIERVKGEQYNWEREKLSISEGAWQKLVHRGIRPVLVFAHPDILQGVSGAVAYYRTLAMVSQKSMANVGLAVSRYESSEQFPNSAASWTLARHINRIISQLVEADESLDEREFQLWRGMAAGAQAQGSWQNVKGDKGEIVVKDMVLLRLREKDLVARESDDGRRIALRDGRLVVFAAEPDLAIYGTAGGVETVAEVKGGIDPAGVLERLGAAVKSLRRAKQDNTTATTILVLQAVSLTATMRSELGSNRNVIDRWFALEDILGSEESRAELFEALRI